MCVHALIHIYIQTSTDIYACLSTYMHTHLQVNMHVYNFKCMPGYA